MISYFAKKEAVRCPECGLLVWPQWRTRHVASGHKTGIKKELKENVPIPGVSGN
jgi:hypothetical protein